MKFWQKAFMLTFLLFVVAFDMGIFLIANYSYTFSLQNYRERSFGEHYFIASSFSTDLNAILKREGNQTIATQSLISSYDSYYKKQNVSLSLLQKGNLLFGNMPQAVEVSEKLHNSEGERRSIIEYVAGKKYLFVSGSLPDPLQDYTLVYAYDLSEVVQSQAELTQLLIGVSTVITSLLALCLFLIFKKLTRPINELQNATARITTGEYGNRVQVYGHDEIADLAKSFNLMAEEVEVKIEELRLSAEHKQQFIDNLAHELNTPLTTIKGYAQYLQQVNLTEDERMESLNFILSDVNRIQAMASKLLDLALTRSGAIEYKEIQVSTLLEKVSETMNLQLNQKALKIVIHSQLKTISGDAFLLESLLCNLIDNAIKASPCGRTIWLSGFDENHGVIEIRDEGKGMNPNEALHVTEAFYRVDKARTRETGGAGLGLALCKQVAERHNASLEIISNIGKGTRVRLCFTTSSQLGDNTITSTDYYKDVKLQN
ncbi:MAG TPA: HAMP domain-containing sensor histidine kinase [Desulfosporosinus sp.]|nr:HAMP domain-containing sensor histidine kinase [Desulfosporosinus sp.]